MRSPARFFSTARQVLRRPMTVPTTYVLVSYPKSGRTWVRFMIDLYLAKRYHRTFPKVFQIEKDPVVRQRHDIRYKHFVEGRAYYELGCFPERRTLVPNSHAVLLTRNLYATLASAYQHVRYRTGEFTGTPAEFLRSTPKYGPMKIIAYYNLWLELRQEFKSATVVSYERLKQDPTLTLRMLLERLGCGPVDEAFVHEVVEESTVEKMQALSLTEAYRGTILAPTEPTNRNSWKVREGRSDGFRTMFSQDDLRYIARLIEDLLLDKTLVDVSLGGGDGHPNP